MRANPLVWLETDEVVGSQQWASVIVFGRYEELPDSPDHQSARAQAHHLLEQKFVWWEPGHAKSFVGGVERPLVPVFYRIRIVEVTGHRAAPTLES